MTVKFIDNIKTFHLSLFVDLWIKAVVGNHRAAARCRSVRSSLPGRIIFHVKMLWNIFVTLEAITFRTFYEKEIIIVQLFSHLGIVKMT